MVSKVMNILGLLLNVGVIYRITSWLASEDYFRSTGGIITNWLHDSDLSVVSSSGHMTK